MRGRLLLVLVASVAVAGCGAGAGLPPLTFAPVGATWTYKITETPTGGTPTFSTMTLVYRGPTGYRGSSYHLFEVTFSSNPPGFVERVYMVWDGSVTRIKADTFSGEIDTVAGIDTLEIVFDNTWVFNQAEETRSGTAQVYLNGTLLGTTPWSVSTANAGTSVVVVPAGTFETTRWNGSTYFGVATQPYSSYTFAHTEIKREFTDVSNGDLVLFELTSGEAVSLTARAAAQIAAAPRVLKFEDLRKRFGIQ